jgi:cytochrome c-type biogenesis protein CcmH/NrfG
VLAAALVSLFLGLAVGYGTTAPRMSESLLQASTAPADTRMPAPSGKLDPEDVKQTADQQAAPLLAKIESDPKNPELLLRLGAIYYVAQQYQDATGWYSRAVQADPRNLPARNKLAASLFRQGDAGAAIQQLRAALRISPTDADSLYNLGVIDLGGKGDVRGALAAWQKLLQSNPQLSPDRKAAVLQLIANTMNFVNAPHALEGVHGHAGHKAQAE